MRTYIIGYGSLFKKSSLNRTLPDVNEIKPILLKNYKRSWNAIENITPTFSTTFLGVEKSFDSQMNAIIFEVENSMIGELDKREFLYNRIKVEVSDIEFLASPFNVTDKDNIWIYVTKEPAKPSQEYPIIQSYVDICISGCFEIEKDFKIDGFAKTFLLTTQQWSENWVNDRIFPRAPHIHQPDAYRIDKLIYENLEKYFRKIVIE